MKTKKVVLFVLASLLIFFLSLRAQIFSFGSRLYASEIHVFLNSQPSSIDPYEFNYFDNRPLVGSIYSSLFSSYKDGKLSPILVRKWNSSDSDRIWKFIIRDDVLFSDGSKITPIDVKNSLKRIFILSNQKKSIEPLLENVIGANKLKKIDQEIAGITSDEESITVKLKESDPQLIEKLSFGMYAIVSPKNYDPNTLKWTNSTTIYSGAYVLDKKKESSIELFKRSDFPEDLSAAKAFNRIVISWDKSTKDKNDLISSYNDNEQSAPEGYEFFGNTNSFLSYLRIYGWENSSSIFSNKKNRLCLRNALYKKLSSTVVRPVLSIYPLVLPGVNEAKLTSVKKCPNFNNHRINVRFIKNTKVKKYAAINEALVEVLRDFNFDVNATEFKNVEETKILAGVYGRVNRPRIDLAALNTDIGNEDPRYTTKFIFSKEGIYFPDPSTEIRKVISNHMFSLNQVNELLFEDSIIWPIFHYSMGFYIRKSKVDLSRYSHQLPLSELHWISER